MATLDAGVLACLVEQAHDAILVLDGDGRILLYNDGAERIFGWTAAEMLGGPLDPLIPPDAVAVHDRHLRGFAEGPARARSMSERAPVRGLRRDGRVFPAQASIAKLDTRDGPMMTVIVSDLTDRERATHDGLTGLPNRMLLTDRIDLGLARQRRTEAPLAVLFLDLDHFKSVNDSLGHDTGDEVLRRAAERLRLAVREADTLARFGGDEFVVLCEDLANPDEARVIAQRIVDAFAEPFVVQGRTLQVHASVGVAVAAADTEGADGQVTPEVLIRDADAAMYHAKEQGRARLAFFEPPLRRNGPSGSDRPERAGGRR